MTLTSTITIRSLADIVTTAIEQKYVSLSNGDNEILAAVQGMQPQIMSVIISTNLAGTFLLESQGDPIFPFMLSAGGGPFEVSSHTERPLFVGNIGGDLNININSSPSAAGIYIQYRYK